MNVLEIKDTTHNDNDNDNENKNRNIIIHDTFSSSKENIKKQDKRDNYKEMYNTYEEEIEKYKFIFARSIYKPYKN